jgi:thiamine-phosphate pyrophosphorylase
LTSRLSIADKHWRSALIAQVAGAITGGVDVVQVRERGLEDREYAAFVRECADLATETRCQIVVNDRVDLALVTGAHGVHLRENSASMAAVRRLVPEDFVIGRAVHDAPTAAAARSADYMIAGSVFESASKPGQVSTLGLEGLSAIVDAAGSCPVWAIGGITAERFGDLKACGVRGVAAIGAFIPSGATDITIEVQALARALRFSLDSHG